MEQLLSIKRAHKAPRQQQRKQCDEKNTDVNMIKSKNIFGLLKYEIILPWCFSDEEYMLFRRTMAVYVPIPVDDLLLLLSKYLEISKGNNRRLTNASYQKVPHQETFLWINQIVHMVRSEQPKQKYLSLSYSRIKDKSIYLLMVEIAENLNLVQLVLRGNQISAVGAKAIGWTLSVNRSLKKLYLQSNNIGDEGTRAIADALKKNTRLRLLELCDNSIGNIGAKAIAEALAENCGLKELHLTENKIGDIGAQAIGSALKGTPGTLKINNFEGITIREEPGLWSKCIGIKVDNGVTLQYIQAKRIFYKRIDVIFYRLCDNQGWIHNYVPTQRNVLDAINVLSIPKKNIWFEDLYIFGNKITDIGRSALFQSGMKNGGQKDRYIRP